MRQALILLVLIVAFLFLPRLWRADPPRTRPQVGPSVYAADGSHVGGPPPAIRPRNLILLLLDTVRRDAVGLGDEAPRQMPALRALARDGVAFRQASSLCSWTLPVITSILTGLLPTEHRVRREVPTPTIPAAHVTYAEVLQRSYGFQTAAFSDVPFQRGRRTSVLQGFETGSAGAGLLLRDRRPLSSGFWLHGGAEIIATWAEQRDRTRPFFLFLHTYDAHDAYGRENHPPAILVTPKGPAAQQALADRIGPPAKLSDPALIELLLTNEIGRQLVFSGDGRALTARSNRYRWRGFQKNPDAAMVDRIRRKYLGGVRWTDAGLSSFVAALKAQGLLDDTLLVIFSDHGEAFAEHNLIGHGRELHEELIRVPLVMVGPGPFARPQVIDGSVGLTDILPTFMDWIGAPDISGAQGRSLLPMLRGDAGGHPVTAQVDSMPSSVGIDAMIITETVRSAAWKYVLRVDVQAGTVEETLFDLTRDPGEQDGRPLSADVTLPGAFCDQVEVTRNRVWTQMNDTDQANQVSPIYTMGGASIEAPRPPPIKANDR